MSRRRQTLLAVGLLVVVTVAPLAAVAWWTLPTPGITLENVDLIRYGMTLGQVERLFGSRGQEPKSRVLVGSKPNTKEWLNPETGFIVGVTFDHNGRAVEGMTMSGLTGFSFIPHGSLLDRLRWRLGL